MPRLALTPKCVLCGAQRDTSWLRAEGIKGVRQRDGNAKNQEREREACFDQTLIHPSHHHYTYMQHILCPETQFPV